MDHGWSSLEYPAGRIGRFDFNLVAVDGLAIRLRVLGNGGETDVDVIHGVFRWRTPVGDWHEQTYPASQPVCGFVGMRECLSAFIEAVRAGPPSEADTAVARRVYAAMLACAQAEAARATVNVKPLT